MEEAIALQRIAVQNLQQNVQYFQQIILQKTYFTTNLTPVTNHILTVWLCNTKNIDLHLLTTLASSGSTLTLVSMFLFCPPVIIGLVLNKVKYT